MDLENNNYMAIVGISCRFPGEINSSLSFWNFLCDKKDAIVSIPKDRWDNRKFYDEDPNKPGKSYVKYGGFLKHDIKLFDADFFQISPREAVKLDPQQRLLLEVAWEAIEDSGQNLTDLQTLKTGVFIGGFCLDSKLIQLNPLNRENISSFTSSGITMSILSNRISHAFNFKGPSITIDTACSSSLVATHLACQSIKNGDCDVALVGGVNVMLDPNYLISMSKGKFLSPTGRCHAFDSRADGYVRGEGCGMVMLKPLKKALEDNDRIYSIILSSGINQDGRTAGISLPNPQSQESLIREVYAKANIAPEEIDYVEAHGTGTAQGDYAEAMVLHNIFKHRNNKCLVGSVKTNIGHLEAGAGIAGMIKTILCLDQKSVPANLHFDRANEKLNYDQINIKIPREIEKLSSAKDTHYAAVNSFGYGGTNAHVLLRSYNKISNKKREVNWPLLFPLSAKDPNALSELAARHFKFITDQPTVDLTDISYSLTRRTSHEFRAVIVCNSAEELLENLRNLAKGAKNYDRFPQLNKKLIFSYSGMGPQWWGMGQQLAKECQQFNDFIQKCDRIFQPLSGWSLSEEIFKNKESSRIQRADVAQPLNFVIQVGISEILNSWGIKPDAVVGHSVGEISAAYVAGALTLEEALLISFHRSRLQQRCAGKGAMLVVNLSVAEVTNYIDNNSALEIAAINGDNSLTLAGDPSLLKQLAKELSQQGIFNKALDVDIAYHSFQMEEIQDELIKSLEVIKPAATTIPFYSTVTGQLIAGEALNASYWWKNVRYPVLFKDAIDSIMKENEFNVLTEVGPHPVTKNYLRERLNKNNFSGKILYSLQRQQDENGSIFKLLAELYATGYNLNWKNGLPQDCQLISLPLYPWQYQPYWLEKDKTLTERFTESDHLFLAKRLTTPHPSWEIELNYQFFPYMTDHVIENQVVFPGTAFVEAGLQVAREMISNSFTLTNITFEQLLVIKNDQIKKLVTEYNQESNRYNIWSSESETPHHWVKHSSGEIKQSLLPQEKVDVAELKNHCDHQVDIDLIYTLFSKQKLTYGSSFRAIKDLWCSDHEVLVQLSHSSFKEQEDATYLIHPILLDAAFHSIMALEIDLQDLPPYLPKSIGEMNFYSAVTNDLWAYVKIIERTDEILRQDVILFDQKGNVFCRIKDLICKRLLHGRAELRATKLLDKLYTFDWKSEPLYADEKASDEHLILIANPSDLIARFLLQSLPSESFTLIALDEISTVHAFDKYSQKNLCVIFLVPALIDGDDHQQQLIENCVNVSDIIKKLDNQSCESKRFIIITQDSQIVSKEDKASRIINASLEGLNYLINSELPTIKTKTLDVPERLTKQIRQLLLAELKTLNSDNDVAFRNSDRFVKRCFQLKTVSESPKKIISSDACYLITGGTSGFGLELAKWLVLNGAKKIVLVSRNGVTTAYAKHTVNKLNKYDCQIIVKKVDVSNFTAVTQLIDEINTAAVPLKGIFHCAMHLEDIFLRDITALNFQRVFQPKIAGTLYLHEASLKLNLDFFVMTSSLASLMGNVGQANYSTANAFLDNFVHYRQTHGLPATTLNIGILADIGVIARSQELSRYTELLAISKTHVSDVITVLETMLSNQISQAALFDVNWQKWREINKITANSSRFNHLKQLTEVQQTNGLNNKNTLQTKSEKPKELISTISSKVLQCVATVLQSSPEKVDAHVSINNMGVDSLIITELRHLLISEFDVDLGIIELLKGVSVNEISSQIVDKLGS